MLDFIRDAPLGSLVLIAMGLIGLTLATVVRAQNDAYQRQAREQDAVLTANDRKTLRSNARLRYGSYAVLIAGVIWAAFGQT